MTRTAAPVRAFWRLDGTYPSRTAALRRVRALRWHPIIIERGLALRIVEVGGAYRVEVGANAARLLRAEG